MAKTLNLGVSGDEGSFSEEAGLRYVETAALSATLNYLIDMEGVLAAVESGTVDLGIFPVANLRGGLVRPAFEAMGRHLFTVLDDLWLEVNQCLLVKPRTGADELCKIVSHPQALAQCKDYIQKNFPNAERVEWEDTAKAARDLASGLLSGECGVIAPVQAAKRFGLKVLETAIQDMKPNLTAFVIVKPRGLL